MRTSGDSEAAIRKQSLFLPQPRASLQMTLSLRIENDLNGADIAVLRLEEPNKWRAVCEHLRCAPPACPFPTLRDLGQRPTLGVALESGQGTKCEKPRRDRSPWVVESRKWWHGICSVPTEDGDAGTGTFVRTNDCLKYLDTRRWVFAT